jgi:hypothetical protein
MSQNANECQTLRLNQGSQVDRKVGPTDGWTSSGFDKSVQEQTAKLGIGLCANLQLQRARHVDQHGRHGSEYEGLARQSNPSPIHNPSLDRCLRCHGEGLFCKVLPMRACCNPRNAYSYPIIYAPILAMPTRIQFSQATPGRRT